MGQNYKKISYEYDCGDGQTRQKTLIIESSRSCDYNNIYAVEDGKIQHLFGFNDSEYEAFYKLFGDWHNLQNLSEEDLEILKKK